MSGVLNSGGEVPRLYVFTASTLYVFTASEFVKVFESTGC